MEYLEMGNFELVDPNQHAVQSSLDIMNMNLKDAENPVYPMHRVTCLAERGLKTRVVSVAPAHTQVLGHCVRKRLTAALRRSPGCSHSLTEVDDHKIAEHLKGGSSEVLVSTDLTRATDLLPLNLLAAIISGLE
jgi:hypothetical protein